MSQAFWWNSTHIFPKLYKNKCFYTHIFYPTSLTFLLFFGGKKSHHAFDIFNRNCQVFGPNMFYFLSNEILPFVVGRLVLPQMRYANQTWIGMPNIMSSVFVSFVIYFWKSKHSAVTYFTICELYLLLIWLKQLEMEIVRAI